jgi:hypothetical protein
MTNKEFAAELRKVAEVYEREEGVDLPFSSGLTHFQMFIHDRRKLEQAVRAFGSGEKRADAFGDPGCFDYWPAGYPLVRITAFKDGVCTRVKTGTRTVPAQVIPAQKATEKVTIPEHEEDVYEWDCGPVLAGGWEDEGREDVADLADLAPTVAEGHSHAAL